MNPEIAALLQSKAQGSDRVSTADCMSVALYDPTCGYYLHHVPMAATGDFITAPELGQLFGEMLGLWVAVMWHQLGSPRLFTLLELGPGLGTMMQDMTRATQNVPGLHDAMHIQLAEISPTLKAVQQAKLAHLPHITWTTSEHEFAPVPLIVVSNEWLDALPTDTYRRHQGAWEMYGLSLCTKQWEWRKVDATSLLPTSMPMDLQEDQLWQHCPVAEDMMTRLATHFKHYGGAMAMIDYGGMEMDTASPTLQAVKDHHFADITTTLGEADLSHAVHFAPLYNVMATAGVPCQPLLTQGEFLAQLGIIERTEQLLRRTGLYQPELLAHTEAQFQYQLHRLLSPAQMGSLFKVMQTLLVPRKAEDGRSQHHANTM
jgi:NADH dehydrogenase [ubiquinone] 1 alpha subcomplex assembly factor 7